MKILFGSFSAITVLSGGVEVQMRSLARELARLGVEVELFDPWKRYRLDEFQLFHLFGAHVGTYHLGRAIKSLGMKLAVTPVFFSRHNPARVAATVGMAMRLRKRGGFWTEHVFCKELCDMADIVLPNTQAEADMLIKAFGIPEGRIRHLPNGVEERFYHARPDAWIKEFGTKGFILYAGHIGWGRKNLLPLLKVLEKTRLPAVLIGPVVANEYGAQCQAVIARSENIKLIPGLPPDSPLLESAYAACDTLVLPSFYETPGLAALEAGLAGAKVCITRFGGTVEYFGEFATYLDPFSEESILKAIRQSLAKPRGTELREHIRANFLWSSAATKLLEVYKGVV
ncbi:MAG: glycosyltransferase family 4 protein [candidate division WOR-3 bacterium]